MVLRSIASLIALMVCAGLSVGCTEAESARPQVRWRPCVEHRDFDCGSLSVPVDWADPAGATIDLAVVRHRADQPVRRVGALVSLPGGPGTSGVDEVIAGAKFSDRIRARFDLISFDPRGVGRSNPVRCDSDIAAQQPNTMPNLGAQLADVHNYARALAQSCRHYTGPLLDHLDAVSVVARDVDALRGALGESRVSLYSRSYGTMSAQAYAELFPTRLRASVLDSVDDHIVTGRDLLKSEARSAADTFGEFVAWCRRAEQCALHGADPNAVFDAIYARAERGELRSPTSGAPIDPLALSSAVTQRLYDPQWEQLAEDLRAWRDTQPTNAAPPARHGPGRPVLTPWVIACSDWQFEIADHSAWLRLWQEQNAAAGPLRAHFAWAAGSVCSGWPVRPPNPPHLPRGDGGPTVLVVNSKHDPATPYEWARNVTAHTPNAVLLTYDGWGHGVYRRTPCTTDAVENYLVDLVVPAPETHCPAG